MVEVQFERVAEPPHGISRAMSVQLRQRVAERGRILSTVLVTGYGDTERQAAVAVLQQVCELGLIAKVTNQIVSKMAAELPVDVFQSAARNLPPGYVRDQAVGILRSAVEGL